MVAVGQFHASMIELETQRQSRIFAVEARQRGLRCRIAMHEGQRRATQRRAHLRTHDEIEQLVAVCLAGAPRVQTQSLRRALQRIESASSGSKPAWRRTASR